MGRRRGGATRVRAAVTAVAVAVGLLAGAPLASAAAPAPASPAPASAEADTVQDVYVREECGFPIPARSENRVQCGTLTVPERRDEGADPERTVEMPVAVIASRDARPLPDPLVVLVPDGPHGDPWDVLTPLLASSLGDDRRIVIVGVRGGILSDPSLACTELGADRLPTGTLVAADDPRLLNAVSACYDRMLGAGLDPAAYTPSAAAADLAVLRSELGYDSWNLYGFAESSLLALTAMREQPAGLRSVILDAPRPPNVDEAAVAPGSAAAAVDAVERACRLQQSCRTRHLDVTSALEEALIRADDDTAVMVVTLEGEAVEVRLDESTLVAVLLHALESPDLVRAVPFVVDRLAEGDADAIRPMVQSAVDAGATATTGLALTTLCTSEVPFSDDEAVAAAVAEHPLFTATAPLALWREACALWAVPARGEAADAAVASEVPTLVFAGEFDPHTSEAVVDATVAGLPQHDRVALAGRGHGVLAEARMDACAEQIAQQFLDDPAAELTTTCATRSGGTVFLTTAEVHPTTVVYDLTRDVQSSPLTAGLVVGLIIALVLVLLYAVVYGLRWLASRHGDAPAGTMLAAGTAAALNLLYVGGMAWVLAGTDPLARDYGIPAAAWPLVILAWAAIAATALLTALVIRAWITGDGTTGHRIALSLATVALFGFSGLLLVRGILLV